VGVRAAGGGLELGLGWYEGTQSLEAVRQGSVCQNPDAGGVASSPRVMVLSVRTLTVPSLRADHPTTHRPMSPPRDTNRMVDVQAPSARRLIDAERRVHRILRARFTDALLELGVSFA
jgi:hypothetical protein